MHPSTDEPREVVITDIQLPFMTIVMLMIKWAIAAIPALIILWLIAAFVSVLLIGVFGGALGFP